MMPPYVRPSPTASERGSSCQSHHGIRPIALTRLMRARNVCGTSGKICPAERATELLEAIIVSGDRVVIEGDNQKQADPPGLAAGLAALPASTICT